MKLEKKHSIDSEIGELILPLIFIFFLGFIICIEKNYLMLLLWIPFYASASYWLLLQKNRLVLYENGFQIEYVIKKGNKTSLIDYKQIQLITVNCKNKKGGYSISLVYLDNKSPKKNVINFKYYIPKKEVKFLKQKGVKLVLKPIEEFSAE
jgi:hypothetical protein